MAFVLVCLFTTFFEIDMSLHKYVKLIEKAGFDSKFPFAFTNTSGNYLKTRALHKIWSLYFWSFDF